MVERTVPHRRLPIPLHLAGGRRIVTLEFEPVLGWLGGEGSGAAQPLTLPAGLLEPSITTNIVYACNLPAPHDRGGDGAGAHLPMDSSGSLPEEIAGSFEAEFSMGSLPGGQIGIVSCQGEHGTVKFRWLCVTAHASIGAVWRCFVCTRARNSLSPWTAIEHDYVFEAGGSSLLSAPGMQKIALREFDQEITLTHPEEMLTSFSCLSGRVKITHLRADGWVKRELLSLMLNPDCSIAARFSDGAQMTVATAAPAYWLSARAA
jgi:hypothetical protein